MSNRLAAFVAFLILATCDCVSAESKSSVKGSIRINGKTCQLNYVRAFRIKLGKTNSIAVIASEKPIELHKPTVIGPEYPRYIAQPSILERARINGFRPVARHMQAVFDESTGRCTAYQGSIDGHMLLSLSDSATVEDDKGVIRPANNDVVGEFTAKFEGQQIIGSGRLNAKSGDDRFNFEFKAPIESLELFDETEDGESKGGDLTD